MCDNGGGEHGGSQARYRRYISEIWARYRRDVGEHGGSQALPYIPSTVHPSISHPYLPHISAPYLPCISPASPIVSPLHLPCISQALEALEAAEEMLDAWKREHG